MAKGKKYYVVWVGNEPGIYDSWEACQLQIKGYPQARYKSFKSLEEAKEAYSQGTAPFSKKSKSVSVSERTGIVWKSISVDAACSGNPGLMEYRAVDTKSKDQIFHQGPFEDGTNNIGEFLALVHALAFLKKKGMDTYPIYTDSRTALAWVRNKKVKTTLVRNRKNEQLFELMERAILWLKKNTYSNPIMKWDTEKWGEIPADFGRK
ncbi:MAG: viroplasmin family protein [Saprospiraceae bacterium]|nr:viroplasmin family protein [Saprospiraceae bacterium]